MALNYSQNFTGPFNYSVQSSGRNTNAVSLSTGSIVITAATLLLNVGVLFILLKQKARQTPFNVYIVVLLASNVIYVGIQTHVSIVTTQVGYWWIGFSACTLNIYCGYVVAAITVHTHVLISINRAWALFWPVSYKHHHTSRMAWLLCVLVIIYLHLLLLPGIILDAMYYRAKAGCFLNVKFQYAWYMFITVWVFDVSKLFIPVCYPLLLWKYLNRRIRPSASRPGNSNTKSAASHTKESAARPTRNKGKSSRSFILLTLFTIGAAVCWIPGLVYYILVTYIPESELTGLSAAKSALYPLLALVDPIFFYITNLHDSTANIIRKCFVRKNGVGSARRTGN